MKMKIAIYGGSFDPIHNGHVNVVQTALKTLDIDYIIILPTFLNPFKNSSFIDENIKLDLLKELFEEYEKVVVSSYEVEQKREVATIESVEHFINFNKNIEKLYLIIGADNLGSLPKWKEYEKLASLVEFVVASRDNIEVPSSYKKLHVEQNISSTFLRKEFDTNKVPPKIANKLRKIYEQKIR
ncbi:MAG: nicotinate (nicotinamide) nucleotide adenylyltransferase [Campylobacterota bacterium]|nr:nicotinate (nicotinamide) nucleotide adenylyltransferase [Campylobacterota bacterium]